MGRWDITSKRLWLLGSFVIAAVCILASVKGFARICGDKLFCCEKFYCTYAHYSVNTISTKICQRHPVNVSGD